MLKQRSTFYNSITIVTDLALCIGAVIAAVAYIGADSGMDLTHHDYRFVLFIYLFLAPVITIFSLHIAKLYESLRTKSYFEVFLSLVQGLAMAVVFLTALAAVLDTKGAGILTEGQRENVPQISMVLAYSIVCFLMLVTERCAVKWYLGRLRRHARNIRRILIVGTGERAQRLDSVIDFHKHWGLHVVGFVTLGVETAAGADTGLRRIKGADGKEYEKMKPVTEDRIVGDVADIARIIDEHIVDEVVFALSLSEAEHLEKAIEKCEEVGLTFHLVADFLETTISSVDLGRLGSIPLLTFSSTPQNVSALLVKRLMDIVVSGMMLVATSIITIPVAIIIKLTSKGPVFFRQMRSGLNGREFTLYKFRSMVTGAEKLQAGLMDQNEMSGPVFKIERDPRITKIGAFIRKWSIDELPQLINIFMGHMSVVGPRPLPTYEVEKFVRWQRRRLSMKPGLTCVWQTEGRSTITDFDDWMKLDLQYIDNWSLGLDIKIFFKTIPAVLFSRGAS